MENKDLDYKIAFNELSAVVLFGSILNCSYDTREECEKAYYSLSFIVEKMKRLIDRMEN